MNTNKRKASELYADVIVIDDSSDTKMSKIIEDDSNGVEYLYSNYTNNNSASNSTSSTSSDVHSTPSASSGSSSDEQMSNSCENLDISLIQSNNIVNSPDNDEIIERAMNYCGIGVEDNSENNRATAEISGFMSSTTSSSVIDSKDVIITDEDVLNAIDDIVSVIDEEEQLNAAFKADKELLLSEEEEMRVYNSIVNDDSPPSFGITPPQPQTETHTDDEPVTTLGKFSGHAELPLWTDMYMKSC